MSQNRQNVFDKIVYKIKYLTIFMILNTKGQSKLINNKNIQYKYKINVKLINIYNLLFN